MQQMDRVELLEDVPGTSFRKGMIGIIVHEYTATKNTYIVNFAGYNTFEEPTLKKNQLKLINETKKHKNSIRKDTLRKPCSI